MSGREEVCGKDAGEVSFSGRREICRRQSMGEKNIELRFWHVAGIYR